MFYGYIDFNKTNILEKVNLKFFVKNIDDKWLLVDKIVKDDSLHLFNSNLANVGIIKCFYLPKKINTNNTFYSNFDHWKSKVIYNQDNTYSSFDVNEDDFNREYMCFVTKSIDTNINFVKTKLIKKKQRYNIFENYEIEQKRRKIVNFYEVD